MARTALRLRHKSEQAWGSEFTTKAATLQGVVIEKLRKKSKSHRCTEYQDCAFLQKN
jgi:hypothetical protein